MSTVAVNRSPLLLAHDRLLPDLLHRLGPYRLPAETLTLEVTRIAAMRNPTPAHSGLPA